MDNQINFNLDIKKIGIDSKYDWKFKLNFFLDLSNYLQTFYKDHILFFDIENRSYYTYRI